MQYKITDIEKTEYDQLVAIWEDAMRKSHYFLDKADFEILKY